MGTLHANDGLIRSIYKLIIIIINGVKRKILILSDSQPLSEWEEAMKYGVGVSASRI